VLENAKKTNLKQRKKNILVPKSLLRYSSGKKHENPRDQNLTPVRPLPPSNMKKTLNPMQLEWALRDST
jgi:hypothetical protein